MRSITVVIIYNQYKLILEVSDANLQPGIVHPSAAIYRYPLAACLHSACWPPSLVNW